MKRILLIIICIFSSLALFSCLIHPTHPDMVEYSNEEILAAAQEKYSVAEWIFCDFEMRGEITESADGSFEITMHGEQFGTDFENGDNLSTALTSFAGKNGGHDVQGMYSNFLCYVALAKCTDGSHKFIYYNTNLHKDASVSDTIGASDYTFDILPCDVTSSLFTAPEEWDAMSDYLAGFGDPTPANFIYSGDRLTLLKHERYGGVTYVELYREGNEIVYDLLYDKNEYDGKDERRLVYSTSDRYGVIYDYRGLDRSVYFDVTETVTQSTEQESCMTLRGEVTLRDVDGTLLYSRIRYLAEYKVLRDGKITDSESGDVVIDDTDFTRGFMIDKIDGVDHTDSAHFSVTDFYVFYEKAAPED